VAEETGLALDRGQGRKNNEEDDGDVVHLFHLSRSKREP
jgi:hypothetical protein